MRQRRQGPLPVTRMQRAVQIRKRDESLGSTLVAIDIALKRLNPAIDRAIDTASSSSTGSVVGSVVQVPQSNPRQEGAIDWLLDVKETLQELMREAP
jgi:hypothetical protein